ncbi:DinB family protein [Nocardioides mangrovicus]|uniref:DinB family protein n=1 Tax=Nocardioides mangrovicus TaxID=2478913 RepID=A0A3L8P5C0_9ACTN|nr:DinB family protein [Nocardioides mangrovicus]RLV49963.1 DinB family protein [Nocardioides mangrovicus]
MSERDDLLQILDTRRALFLRTVEGIDDDQARTRTTVSELTLGGLVKHVAQTQEQWLSFITEGPAPQPDIDWSNIDWSNPPAAVKAFQEGHRMLPEETLGDLVAAYQDVAARTAELVDTVDLDATQPLPEAPWFEPGASWSARQVLLHLVGETSQHAGHADIIREALDGQKTMG